MIERIGVAHPTSYHEDLALPRFSFLTFSRCSPGWSQSGMIGQSCHRSMLTRETWHRRCDEKAGKLDPVHDKCSKRHVGERFASILKASTASGQTSTHSHHGRKKN